MLAVSIINSSYNYFRIYEDVHQLNCFGLFKINTLITLINLLLVIRIKFLKFFRIGWSHGYTFLLSFQHHLFKRLPESFYELQKKINIFIILFNEKAEFKGGLEQVWEILSPPKALQTYSDRWLCTRRYHVTCIYVCVCV